MQIEYAMLDTLLFLWELLAILALICWVGLSTLHSSFPRGNQQTSAWRSFLHQHFWLLEGICLIALLVAEIVSFFLHLTLTGQELHTSPLTPVVGEQTFFRTDYGLLWIMLILLSGVLVGLSWWLNRRWKLPFAFHRQSQWPLTVPGLLLAGLLFWLELLTFFTPPFVFPASPTNPLPTGTVSSTLTTQTKRVNDLSVTLTVTPGKTDVANRVTVRLVTTDGQAVTNAHITVSVNMEEMDMGTTHATMAGGSSPPYTYQATFSPYITFSMSGVWDITLTIQLPDHTSQTITFTVLFLSQ